MSKDNLKLARELAKWKEKIQTNWHKVRVTDVYSEDGDEIKVGGEIRIFAKVDIDGLKTDEIRVEVFYGPIDSDEFITYGNKAVMEIKQQEKKNSFLYEAVIPCDSTGQHAYSVRILPNHPDIVNPYETGLITWYQE